LALSLLGAILCLVELKFCQNNNRFVQNYIKYFFFFNFYVDYRKANSMECSKQGRNIWLQCEVKNRLIYTIVVYSFFMSPLQGKAEFNNEKNMKTNKFNMFISISYHSISFQYRNSSTNNLLGHSTVIHVQIY